MSSATIVFGRFVAPHDFGARQDLKMKSRGGEKTARNTARQKVDIGDEPFGHRETKLQYVFQYLYEVIRIIGFPDKSFD